MEIDSEKVRATHRFPQITLEGQCQAKKDTGPAFSGRRFSVAGFQKWLDLKVMAVSSVICLSPVLGRPIV